MVPLAAAFGKGLDVRSGRCQQDGPGNGGDDVPGSAASDGRRPAAKAARQAREAERAKRAAEAVARHGSEEAVRADTPRETALWEACRHLAPNGRLGLFEVPGYAKDFPSALRDAVAGAYPLPGTVSGLWEEHLAWERLSADRAALDPEWSPPGPVSARQRLLEDGLDRLPARSLGDVRARLAWMGYVLDLGYSRDVREDDACLAVLRADVEALAAGAARGDGEWVA